MVVHKAHSIPFEEPKPETLEHFKSTPWAAALFSSPTVLPITTFTRMPTTTYTNTLISSTLATNNTVQAWQTFWEPPSAAAPLGQVIKILTVGDGLCGHAHHLHGGFISLLLDEAMNYVGAAHLTPGATAFTAYIKVELKKPCRTPNTILARAWVEERSEGRKLFMCGTVEDGQGDIYSTGESLFIESKKPESKL